MRRVLEVNPHREEALIALAGLLIMRGEAAAAQPLLLRCCGIAPERAEAWDTLGIALTQTGDHALAHTAFVKAQRCAPTTLDYALRRVDAAVKSDYAEADLARLELEGEARSAESLCCRLASAYCSSGSAGARRQSRSSRPRLRWRRMIRYRSTLLGGALDPNHPSARSRGCIAPGSGAGSDNVQLLNDHGAALMRMHRHAEARTVLLQSCNRRTRRRWAVSVQSRQHDLLSRHAGGSGRTGAAGDRTCAGCAEPRHALFNALSYRDGDPGAEILAAARACSDRLPRNAMPAFANTPIPTGRW